MKRVFVCSPFRGADQSEIQNNCTRAERACLYVVRQGHAPFAPHLFYPRFLDDVGVGRNSGIACGLAWLEVCDEVWVFGSKISAGMQMEIEWAKVLGKPVVRLLGPEWE